MKVTLKSRILSRSTVSGAPMPPSGMALIVTLIMLSVITFLAVTFLVLSQRETGSVTTSTEQMVSKEAADSALARAQAELLAPMLAFANDQVYDMIVSTNYINAAGYNPNLNQVGNTFTNVNFDYVIGGANLNAAQRLWVLTNLLYNPRPPVYMTNQLTRQMEFRYYLDLNRNGRYDTNGFQPVMNPNGGFIDTNGNWTTSAGAGTLSNFFIGDPEWIGVLERPELPHAGNNRFVARYAYLVVPAGKTLDVNYIHNQTSPENTSMAYGNDSYFRNQGIGSWEINLAAFLADLNTNLWNPATAPYSYNRALASPSANTGMAFNNALSLLSYRYANNYGFLNSVQGLFGARGAAAFQQDYIDGYSDGPLMLGTANTVDVDTTGNSWAGADNTNRFYSIQDFFDRTKITATAPNFIDRLDLVRTVYTNSSYDRYTYYRMLEQLGTDTAPPPAKLNINYVNVDDAGNIVPDAETNFVAWTAGQFFTNAANRMLLRHTENWLKNDFRMFTNQFGTTEAFGITNLPVFYSYTMTISNRTVTTNIFSYTSGIHRTLQMAANIFEATTNRTDLDPNYPYFPHVYRPIFRRDATNNVFIVGYREVVDMTILSTLQSANQIDLSSPTSRATLLQTNVTAWGTDANEPMVSGIPLIIGAKKGFPNFNKFAMQNAVTVSRDLLFHRASSGGPLITNQAYSFSVSNSFGMQLWNSYSNSYSRDLRLYAVADVTIWMTNDQGMVTGPNSLILSNRFFSSTNRTITANTWQGFRDSQSAVSFIVPVFTNALFLPIKEYLQTADNQGLFNREPQAEFDPINTFRVPHLWLNLRTRVRMTLVDQSVSPNRIVDYVSLDSPADPINLIDAARRTGSDFPQLSSDGTDPGILWNTNRWGDPNGTLRLSSTAIPTYGVLNQIQISAGTRTVSPAFWRAYNAKTDDKDLSIPKFVNLMFVDKTVTTNFAAPFSPTRKFFQYVRWEANDPLVHYTIPDLTDLYTSQEPIQWDTNTKNPVNRLASNNPLSDHYRPWGGNPNNPGETTFPTRWNSQVKDPLVFKSDDWDFPTNKLPNVGWLGRVHRGTPWQTVYMKSSDNTTGWPRWFGNTNYNGADAYYARPINDRDLFDIFSTSINENGQRGQLSINQTNLAAWSAVLSGVQVLANNPGPNTFGAATIQPAALSPEVGDIVTGIAATQVSVYTNNNNQIVDRFPNKRFSRLGDILDVPELTEASPFLNTNALPSDTAAGINDEVLERIPQQIMSLLTLSHSPRFVIYSYGQSLKPAPNSIVTAGGAFFQMCTNYQVTAETATRSVVRVEGSFNPADTNSFLDPLRRYPPRLVVEQFNVLPPD